MALPDTHRLSAATLCLLWNASVLPGQDPVAPPILAIRVPVRLVSVPTLVFSSEGRLISGLDAHNFRVFDNGRRQKPVLDDVLAPFSVAVALQVGRDVRDYVPFIARTGSTFEALLLGLAGEAAILTYGDEVRILKPFESGDVTSTLADLRAVDRQARMIDAGIRAVAMLKERPPSRARILILIGQPMDDGSSYLLETLKERATAANIAIYTLTLPVFGKAFVSDNFTLEGPTSAAERGGFKASVDLGKLISVLSRKARAEDQTDPFSLLSTATGGTQLFARAQREFENAVASIGFQLRSAYQLSYTPTSGKPGYHAIRVEVDVPGATVFARPGYWHTAN